jgi:peptidoglycan/xylan/chitin deacetylase (PgdA/CDA1 family)
MEDLSDAGYSAVFFEDAEEYVLRGKALPEKPVLITFDDGYRSNILAGKEILAEAGMKATVNVIGVSVGKDVYKDTDKEIIPHFSYAEARAAFSEGLMDFQSHSYAMHDSKELEPAASYREGVLPKKGEGERAYIEAFRADVIKSKQEMEKAVGNRVSVYAYPLGFYSDLTESLLMDMGFSVTLTIESGANTLVKGLPQSLLAMRRINVTMDSPDVAELIADR